MSTRGKISELYDLDNIIGQQKAVITLVEAFVKKVDEVKPVKLKLEGSEKTKEAIKGISELGLNVKEYKKITDQLAVSQAKLNALEAEQAKQLAISKQAIAEKNKAVKEEIILEKAAEGSIEQKRIKLTQLQRAYDKLSEAERNAAGGQELLKSVQQLDAELKKLEGSTGRFQRNVGNYANAFSSAFGIVEDSLKKIQQQIQSNNFGGQQLEQLKKQEQILIQLTEQLGQEFSTTKQQSKAFQEATTQLGLAFGQQSKVFQEFKNQVGEGVDSLNDIRDSIKLASSDTKQLDRLIGAATAIAGGFGIAQGAAALFGGENKELEKTFVKLQAVMTILNGLQAIQNELKNKDSILSKIRIALTKEQIATTNAQTAAQNANNTAVNTGTKAVKGFGVALKAIGIGFLLSLLPLLANAMFSSKKKTDELTDSLKEFGETVDEISKGVSDELTSAIEAMNDEMGKSPTLIQKATKSLELLDRQRKAILKDKEFFAFDFSLEGIGNSIQDIGTGLGLVEDRLTKNQEQQDEIRTKITELSYLKRIKAAQEYLDAISERNKIFAVNDAELDRDAANRKLALLRKQFDDRIIQEKEFIEVSKKTLLQKRNSDLQIVNETAKEELRVAADNVVKRAIIDDNLRKDRIIIERSYQDELTNLYDEAEKRRRKIVATTIVGIQEVQTTALSKMAEAVDSIGENPLATKLSEDVKKFKEVKEELKKELADLRADLASTFADAFFDLAGGAFDARKNAIEGEIAALEQRKQKEIEAATASIQNEQDRAAAITTIEARTAAERERLERKKKQVDIQKARFEKIAGVFEIGIDTIKQVAKIKAKVAELTALAAINQIYAALVPIAAAQIPVVIASNAISAAAILARPVPQFKDGLFKDYEGPAIINDGSNPEAVWRERKQAFEFPTGKNILTNIEKGDRVFPDANVVMNDLEKLGMAEMSKRIKAPITEDAYAIMMTQHLSSKLNDIKSAIENKPVPEIKNSFTGWEVGYRTATNYHSYIHENTQF